MTVRHASLERTLAAEAAGFDSVWLMDHLVAPAAPEHDTFEGWTLAAALAVRTSTIRIGHLVTCDPFRHPAVLAKMAATVDVLSDGRLELGLGWGSVRARARDVRDRCRAAGGAGAPDARDDRDPRPACSPASRSTTTATHSSSAARSGDRVRCSSRDRRCTSAARGRGSRCRSCATTPTGGTARPTRSTGSTELRPLAGDAPRLGAAPGRAGSRTTRHATRPSRSARAPVRRRGAAWSAAPRPRSSTRSRADVAAGVEGFVVQLTDFGHPDDRRALHDRGRTRHSARICAASASAPRSASARCR